MNKRLALILVVLLVAMPVAALAEPPKHLAYRYHLYESMGPVIPHGVIKVDVSGVITYRLIEAKDSRVVYEYNITVKHLDIQGLPGGNATRQAFLRAFAGSSAVMINLTSCSTRLEVHSREAGVVAGALPVYCTPEALKKVVAELRERSRLNVSLVEENGGYLLTAEGVRRSGNTTTTLTIRAFYDKTGVLDKLRIVLRGSAGAAGSLEMRVELDKIASDAGEAGLGASIVGGSANPLWLAIAGGVLAVIIAVVVAAARRGR